MTYYKTKDSSQKLSKRKLIELLNERTEAELKEIEIVAVRFDKSGIPTERENMSAHSWLLGLN